MKVFTYYNPVPNLISQRGFMLPIWRRSWERYGWEAVILTADDASRCPLFGAINLQADVLPTVNDREYERAAYARWCAMEQLGGLSVDNDVINRGFLPSDMPNVERLTTLNHRGNAVCALIGTRLQYANVLEMMAAWPASRFVIEDGGPHMSDMHMLQDVEMDALCIVKEYSVGVSAPLVHCSFQSTSGQGIDRESAFREMAGE